MAKHNHPEDTLQIAAIHYLRLNFPDTGDVIFFHCPSGGKRSIREAARFKHMGVIPGIPDLIFYWPGGHGAIELKSPIGRLRDSQIEFRDRYLKTGGKWALCRSLEEIEQVLISWGLKITAFVKFR